MAPGSSRGLSPRSESSSSSSVLPRSEVRRTCEPGTGVLFGLLGEIIGLLVAAAGSSGGGGVVLRTRPRRDMADIRAYLPSSVEKLGVRRKPLRGEPEIDGGDVGEWRGESPGFEIDRKRPSPICSSGTTIVARRGAGVAIVGADVNFGDSGGGVVDGGDGDDATCGGETVAPSCGGDMEPDDADRRFDGILKSGRPEDGGLAATPP